MSVLVRPERPTSTERVLGWLYGVAAVEFVVLAATGLFLLFFYRPATADTFGDLPSEPAGIRLIDAVRLLHRAAAGAVAVTFVAVAVMALAAAAGRARVADRARASGPLATRVAIGVGMATAVLFALFSGYQLPWNQLFLWAGKVASDIRGFRLFVWHPSVIEHATVRGSVVPITLLRLWLLVHVVVIPAALLALGVLAARRLSALRDRRLSRDRP